MEFLYANGEVFTFMNQETYEQVEIQGTLLGDDAGFLKENLPVTVLFYKGRAVNITLPNFIETEIVQTEPAVKGNTSGNVLKAAKIALESGGGS